MNPLGNAIVQQNPMLQNLAETIRFARSFQSPQAFMQEMQRQNPQMYQYMVQLSQTMQNPSAVAQQMMTQQGISPEQLNAMLR